jgi:hypothetical protein
MELNHGCLPRQWSKRSKLFITDVPVTSQGNTSTRIQMKHGHVPQVLKCLNKLVSPPFKTILQNGEKLWSGMSSPCQSTNDV